MATGFKDFNTYYRRFSSIGIILGFPITSSVSYSSSSLIYFFFLPHLVLPRTPLLLHLLLLGVTPFTHTIVVFPSFLLVRSLPHPASCYLFRSYSFILYLLSFCYINMLMYHQFIFYVHTQ